MKLLITFITTLIFSSSAAAQQSWTADNGNGTYTNPLMYDEFSDPDILRVGDDYYLAGTTMHTVPGVNILHSKDLVNWEQVSYCFDRFPFKDKQFYLKDHHEVYGQGIWAPCIRYANGQFYVFSNVNGKGLQCWTSKDIHGPWQHHNLKGKIYDLSVLFDTVTVEDPVTGSKKQETHIYAIHGYGKVHCTELKPDLSEPIMETDSIIIPEGSAVGEGHHIYKINDMYYLISTDYRPNGRTICSRAKSIWGPYEQCTITADETFGYFPAGLTKWKGRIVPDSTTFKVSKVDTASVAAGNIHQGGIVQTQKGDWYALLMMDFHSIGRTVTLAPITWTDGWPMVGLSGNLGRAPRTWTKPDINVDANDDANASKPHAPYERNGFNKRCWQWNHNPDTTKARLTPNELTIQTQPAEQLMWAKNTLTQRAIGPRSICTVKLDISGLKDGDVAGLGNINVPCSWVGVVKEKNTDPSTLNSQPSTLKIRCFEQLRHDTVDISINPHLSSLTLRIDGDWDNNHIQYSYSLDGKTFRNIGKSQLQSYQLCTFQGGRISLFAFNRVPEPLVKTVKGKKETVYCKGHNGGVARFSDFTCVEPDADRSGNIPYGKKIKIVNLASGEPMYAMYHGMLYDTEKIREAPEETSEDDTITINSPLFKGKNRKMLYQHYLDSIQQRKDSLKADMVMRTTFHIVDRGHGTVLLQCEDGRYVFVQGFGLPGDVCLTKDVNKAEEFMWQDYLGHQFMLLSTRTHLYLGKSPTTGSPYSLDFKGADPARKNGAVFKWQEIK